VSGKTANTFTFIEFYGNTYDFNELSLERSGNYEMRPLRIKRNSTDIFHFETHPEYIKYPTISCKDYPQDIVDQIGDFDSDVKPEEVLSEDSSISGITLLVNSILNSNFFLFY
jgi:hypothetical protein